MDKLGQANGLKPWHEQFVIALLPVAAQLVSFTRLQQWHADMPWILDTKWAGAAFPNTMLSRNAAAPVVTGAGLPQARDICCSVQCVVSINLWTCSWTSCRICYAGNHKGLSSEPG